MLASWPMSQWISTARARVAMKCITFQSARGRNHLSTGRSHPRCCGDFPCFLSEQERTGCLCPVGCHFGSIEEHRGIILEILASFSTFQSERQLLRELIPEPHLNGSYERSWLVLWNGGQCGQLIRIGGFRCSSRTCSRNQACCGLSCRNRYSFSDGMRAMLIGGCEWRVADRFKKGGFRNTVGIFKLHFLFKTFKSVSVSVKIISQNIHSQTFPRWKCLFFCSWGLTGTTGASRALWPTLWGTTYTL